MGFLISYKLPDDIGTFIATGRESAQHAIERYEKKQEELHGAKQTISLDGLAETFTHTHHDMYFQASRNNPAHFNQVELRDNLQSMIMGAAALCDIAHRMRQIPDRERRHQEVELLGHEAKEFYQLYTRHTLSDRIIRWLDVCMTPEEKSNRKEILEALRGMWDFPQAQMGNPPSQLTNKPIKPSLPSPRHYRVPK